MHKSRVILILIFTYSLILMFLSYNMKLTMFQEFSGTFIIILSICIYILLILAGTYFQIKEKLTNSKEIVFIAIFSAFTSIARIPFIPLPSIQPCTYLIICAGIVFGPLIGFLIGMNTAIISNFVAGQGPWTLYQIVAWGLVGFLSGLIEFLFHFSRKNVKHFRNRFILCSFGFICGLIYGLIMNIWSWLILEPPLTLDKFLLIYLTSFPFDIAHGISNVIFIWIFGPQTIHILLRYKNRLFTEIISDNPSAPQINKIRTVNKGNIKKLE